MRKRHLHLYLACPGAAAPLFEFAPVSSSGPFSIDGHEVFIPQGGVDVTLEVFLSASGPRLVSTYQAQILGETSYAGGDAGFLTPLVMPDRSAATNVIAPSATNGYRSDHRRRLKSPAMAVSPSAMS